VAVAAGQHEQLLVGGRWVGAQAGSRFDVTDPATGEPVGSVPDAGEADVRAAIDAAAAALEDWRSRAAIERARILRRAADLMRERKSEIGAVMTAEQGKPQGRLSTPQASWSGSAARPSASTGRSCRPRTRATACSCSANRSA
jgi:acyl-CoA reductase-like NAD-dependent aldehyde dehydrogenase